MYTLHTPPSSDYLVHTSASNSLQPCAVQTLYPAGSGLQKTSYAVGKTSLNHTGLLICMRFVNPVGIKGGKYIWLALTHTPVMFLYALKKLQHQFIHSLSTVGVSTIKVAISFGFGRLVLYLEP